MALQTLVNRTKRASKVIGPAAARVGQRAFCLSHLSNDDLDWLIDDVIRLQQVLGLPEDRRTNKQVNSLLVRLGLRLFSLRDWGRLQREAARVEPGPPDFLAVLLGECWEKEWQLQQGEGFPVGSPWWNERRAPILDRLERLRRATGAEVNFTGVEPVPESMIGMPIRVGDGWELAAQRQGEPVTLQRGHIRLAEGRGTLAGHFWRWVWDSGHSCIVKLLDRDGQPGQPSAGLPSRAELDREAVDRLLTL